MDPTAGSARRPGGRLASPTSTSRLNEAGHPAIRQGHGCVFRFIHEGGSRLTDLAESSGLTKQAVGEVVADLEELGYVERAPDPRTVARS